MATQAEIRRAELARERRKHPVSVLALRLAELNRILRDRYRGEALPDGDDAREDAMIVAHHLAYTRNPVRGITAWLALRCPWMLSAEVEQMIGAVMANPRRWRADTLGRILNLNEEDRRRLRIRTIGCVGATKEARAELTRQRKCEKQRERDRRRRQIEGRQSRENYLASSLTKSRPWLADGVQDERGSAVALVPQVTVAI